MTLEQFFNHPIVVAGGSVLVVAIVNAVVRQIGKGAKTPARLAATEKAVAETAKAIAYLPERVASLEASREDDRQFKRTMLTVTSHQTAALSTLLEVTKGKKVNGNVDKALLRMEEAQQETDRYLVETSTGGKR